MHPASTSCKYLVTCHLVVSGALLVVFWVVAGWSFGFFSGRSRGSPGGPGPGGRHGRSGVVVAVVVVVTITLESLKSFPTAWNLSPKPLNKQH